MTARFHTRGPRPAIITRMYAERFLVRENRALIEEVLAIKHQAHGETFNPRTGSWEGIGGLV